MNAIAIKRRFNIPKLIRFQNQYYFSLDKPRWPSPAFDRMAARGGLSIGFTAPVRKRKIEMAILGISCKCTYACKHCYELPNLSDQETIPIDKWLAAIRAMQKIGTGIIVLSGGEPLLRFNDVLHLLKRSDKEQSEFHIHTSGYSLTAERATALRRAGLYAAGVGLDDADPGRNDSLRGTTGAFDTAVHALTYLREAGIFTYLNTCLSGGLVRSDGLWRLLELAHSLNIGAIRLLEPKPCGGYLHHKDSELFTPEDRRITTDFFMRANNDRSYRGHPAVFYLAYIESPQNMGCMMGGLSHLYIDGQGHVTPCVFVPVTFGSIACEPFDVIYERIHDAVPFPQKVQCTSDYLASAFSEYQSSGHKLPIPYESIREKWGALFERAHKVR